MRATDMPFNIDKKLVYEAYKAIRSGRANFFNGLRRNIGLSSYTGTSV